MAAAGLVHVSVHLDGLDGSTDFGLRLLGQGPHAFVSVLVGDVTLLATSVEQLDRVAGAVAEARVALVGAIVPVPA